MLSARPTRILIIEDEPADREIYKHYLKESSEAVFEFENADCARAGIELCRTRRPDCVLLDFNLPDMDGIETLAELRDHSGRFPCAVVMLTAYGGESLAVKAIEAGAMDYLPKGQLAGGAMPRAVMKAIEKFQMQQRIEEHRLALERSERRYQILLEAIPQMVWTADADGRIEYANRQWLEYTGLNAEETDRLGWDRLLHPDDLDRTWTAWNEATETGSVFEIEHRLRRALDESYRWHLVRAVPMRAEGRKIINWFGTCTEIENQKQTEYAVLQKHKLEGIGLLAGGVAHDFNNLLTGILGGASFAIDSLPSSHPAQDMLKGVVEAGERAAELTRKMLAYAGKGAYCIEPLNVGLLVRHTCEALRPSIPGKIRLKIHSATDLPLIETDYTQMRQVVVDLVMNAVEAIGERAAGTVSVRTALLEGDEELPRQFGTGHDRVPPGSYIGLEVRDTGCGMDEEMQKKIFDPFFTTKFLGRGLGLSAVHGFVRSAGGRIQVDSAPGQGTRFRILLPVEVEHAKSQHAAHGGHSDADEV